MNLTWYYLHWVAAIIIVVTDHYGTLEPAVNKFEERLGIRTELPPNEEVPYYISPIEEVDSTFILPSYLQIKKDTTSANIPSIR